MTNTPSPPAPYATVGQRIRAVLPAALLAVSQLLLFGPYTIYALNRAEIAYPFAELAALWLVWGIALVAGIVAFAAALPRPAAAIWIALWTALAWLLWFEGNLFVGAYGELDGGGLDFAGNAWRLPWELALWIGLPLAAIVFRHRLSRLGPALCWALLVTQAVAMPFTGRGDEAAASRAWTAETTPEALFAFAPKDNAVILVLDAFQADVFAEIVAEDPARYDRMLEGFVYYREHLGAFPTTKFSVPAMLSGTSYDNRSSSWAYLDRALGEQSVFHRLKKHGFEIDLMTISRPFVRGDLDHGWIIPRPYNPRRAHRRAIAAQLVDLAAFRHLPHPGKRWVYNDEAWRLQRLYTQYPAGFQAVHSRAFLRDLGQRMHIDRRGPVLKVIHVGGAHPPIVLDAECRVLDTALDLDRPAFRDQARCALRSLGDLLDRFRALDLYDDALLIVASDHGIGLPPAGLEARRHAELAKIVGRAAALLLIKPPGSQGPLRTSAQPSHMTDVAATLLDALGLPTTAFPGTPIPQLSDDPRRPRTFGDYRWSKGEWKRDDLSALHRYTVRGPWRDPASWRYGDTVLSASAELQQGALDLRENSVEPHLGPGWGAAADDNGRWAHGDEAVILLPLDDRAYRLDVELLPSNDRDIDIEAELDGRRIARWQPRGSALVTLTATLPPSPDRPEYSALVLRFARPPGDDGLRAIRVVRVAASAR